MIRLAGSAALVLLLAACVPPPTAAPAPAPLPDPAPIPAPAPAPAPSPVAVPHPVISDWVHAPLTAGDWTWRSSGADNFAEYASPQGIMLAQFTCTADREMLLAMASQDASAGAITVRTETSTRQLRADAREGWLETRLPSSDALLDAMAFSRGRFALEAGTTGLYLPSYPEITRVIEDCR